MTSLQRLSSITLPTSHQHPGPVEKGLHYELIKNNLPSWLTSANLNRLHPLKRLALQRPAWHATATTLQHATLKKANAEAWSAQNTLDQKLRDVQDVYAFAEPLLKKAIKDQYGLDLDVKATFLHIYTLKEQRWYILDFSKGARSRSVSLLDAALHNFARHEKFDKDSGYITQPNQLGHYVELHYESTMSLEQFKALCRELNVGERYEKHLSNYLLPSEPVARGYLKSRVIASQKAAFKAAAHRALMNNDLEPSAYATVLRVLTGNEKRAQLYQLNMLDTPLSGILLIANDLDKVSRVSKLIAYIPHDPESPLRQYDSSVDFVVDLARKLRLSAPSPSLTAGPYDTYQQFFSQFVPHSQRGHFFATLNERLYQVKWHERGPLDPAPSWRAEPTTPLKLQISGRKIRGEVWQQLYQSALNKILNDGRTLAVSTAQADSNERAAWWDNILKIGSDIFNAALLVIAPFVPFLGELMLAYTLYQVTDDVLESVVELSEGQASEAAEHIVGVVIDVVQLAALGAGGVLAKEVVYKSSPFVDSLKAVNVKGSTRLWNPDIAPYARQDLPLPSDAKPDALGLREHQQHKVISLDDQHFVVEHDAQNNTHRIKHPTRPRAYSPIVEPNGSGAWVHEGEDPWTWDPTQLHKRLGHATQGLSSDEVAQACQTSGTHDGALRKMYLDRAPTPPLLADSLDRLKLYHETTQLPQKIRAGEPTGDWFTWSAQLTTEQHSWPPGKAIKVFDSDAASMVFGAADADAAHTLAISTQDVRAGKLPEQLVRFLSEAELQTMLPTRLPETAETRASALRNQLANDLDSTQGKIATFNHLYSTREVLDTEPAKLLQKHYPDLPTELVQRLMLRTSPNEVKLMTQEQKIPLRLKNLARELQNETRASHALEGYYNEVLLTPDTERMALNTLRLYTDALGNLQITVREQTPGGTVRCQVGREDASSQKTLLRKDNGRYEIYNPDSQATQPQYDFFNALLRTVPDGKVDYVPGQGGAFRQWLQEKLEPPAERVTALEPDTVRQTHPSETQALLQKPTLGKFFRWITGESSTSRALEQRMRNLCPSLSDEQLQSLLPELNTETGKHALRALESEKRVLLDYLERWQQKPTLSPRYSVPSANEMLMRTHIIEELQLNWSMAAPGRITETAVNPRSTLLDLSNMGLGRYIRSLELPMGCFDHITRLNLGATDLSDADTGVLNHFPNVRQMDLGDNGLSRVPAELTAMPNLAELTLRHNPVAWYLTDYQTLAQCQRLRWLELEGHTDLLIAPDIRSLPDLESLNMRSTRISQWPVGLDTPRRPNLELNMINTQVTGVPEYPPASQAAQIIARSWLDRSKLTPDDEQRLVTYRRTAGLDPYRTAPAEGLAASDYWLSNLTPRGRADAQAMWNDLEQEHGSQGFFDVLKLLQPPEHFETAFDEQRYARGTQDLIYRVQSLLIAVDRDPQLRERLFSLAATPAYCADAGAQIFNRMGLEVLEANILADTTPAGLAARESRLVTLARQKWRLERLNESVREDIRHRTTPESEGGLGQTFGSGDNQVDEVEVYLAYQTGLKRRLGLPWLSEHMVYRDTADVTPQHLATAYRKIEDLEEGDGLIDGLLQQDFWSDHLEEMHRDAFEQRREQRAQAGSDLDDLIAAQEQWHATDVASKRKAQLREQLIDLANKLIIPLDEVLSEETFSQATLERFYEHIQHNYKELGRQLTRQALQKAGLVD